MKLNLILLIIFYLNFKVNSQSLNDLPNGLIYLKIQGVDVVINFADNKSNSQFIEEYNKMIRTTENATGKLFTYNPGDYYYFDNIKYLDKIFRTKLNENLWMFSNTTYEKDNEDLLGITLIMVVYKNNKEAKCDCEKIYKYYENNTIDVFTDHISCINKDNYLNLYIFKGISNENILNSFDNLTNYKK